MRLVATLTTGSNVELACEHFLLATAAERGLGALTDELEEHRWVETTGGAWIRRDAIIALALEDA